MEIMIIGSKISSAVPVAALHAHPLLVRADYHHRTQVAELAQVAQPLLLPRLFALYSRNHCRLEELPRLALLLR